METSYPSSHSFNSSRLMQGCKSSTWTKEENKKFESALAFYENDTPDRWIKIANMIPGKSLLDVIEHYKELVADISDIEAGVVPVPDYLASSLTIELVKKCEFNPFQKRTYRSSNHEKKKGVPWTEEEHRRFLMGLQKHGKGDWRNISRNFVRTKTSTQVASHAQKYYLRQLSERKEKRRPSIHDITTCHLTNNTQSGDYKVPSMQDYEPTSLPQQDQNSIFTPKMTFLDWNHSDDKSLMAFRSACDTPLITYPREISSRRLKQKGGGHGADIGLINLGFQFQSTRPQIW